MWRSAVNLLSLNSKLTLSPPIRPRPMSSLQYLKDLKFFFLSFYYALIMLNCDGFDFFFFSFYILVALNGDMLDSFMNLITSYIHICLSSWKGFFSFFLFVILENKENIYYVLPSFVPGIITCVEPLQTSFWQEKLVYSIHKKCYSQP